MGQSLRGTPLDLRPWATWKRENLLATKSGRAFASIAHLYPRFFTSLPYLEPLMRWRIYERPLSP